MNPYKISGPTKISFSGGRTSGFMLKRCLEAGLDSETRVVFANTGKEREETLVFVDQCSKAFGVLITWLERDDASELGYREVTFETAARDGKPFARLIEERNYLPNPVTRFCTEELKIRVMKKWMVNQGFEHWTDVIGLRADEPRRVSRMRNSGRDVALPLAEAGVTVADVDAFWKAQSFDLKLKKWEGNCDLCFLKGRAKRTRIMRDNPEAAAWWIAQETTIRVPKTQPFTEDKIIEHDPDDDDPQTLLGFDDEYFKRVIAKKHIKSQSHPFRIDAPRYKDLFTLSQQPLLGWDIAELEGESSDDIGDCFCNAA